MSHIFKFNSITNDDIIYVSLIVTK
jgi:hypothetical protein